jgi:hypothetical protein
MRALKKDQPLDWSRVETMAALVRILGFPQKTYLSQKASRVTWCAGRRNIITATIRPPSHQQPVTITGALKVRYYSHSEIIALGNGDGYPDLSDFRAILDTAREEASK